MGLIGNIVAGVRVVLVSLQNYKIPHAFSLTKSCSNNVAEYNTLFIGMQLAEEIGVKHLKAYDDSKFMSTRFARSTKSDMKT